MQNKTLICTHFKKCSESGSIFNTLDEYGVEGVDSDGDYIVTDDSGRKVTICKDSLTTAYYDANENRFSLREEKAEEGEVGQSKQNKLIKEMADVIDAMLVVYPNNNAADKFIRSRAEKVLAEYMTQAEEK